MINNHDADIMDLDSFCSFHIQKFIESNKNDTAKNNNHSMNTNLQLEFDRLIKEESNIIDNIRLKLEKNQKVNSIRNIWIIYKILDEICLLSDRQEIYSKLLNIIIEKYLKQWIDSIANIENQLNKYIQDGHVYNTINTLDLLNNFIHLIGKNLMDVEDDATTHNMLYNIFDKYNNLWEIPMLNQSIDISIISKQNNSNSIIKMNNNENDNPLLVDSINDLYTHKIEYANFANRLLGLINKIKQKNKEEFIKLRENELDIATRNSLFKIEYLIRTPKEYCERYIAEKKNQIQRIIDNITKEKLKKENMDIKLIIQLIEKLISEFKFDIQYNSNLFNLQGSLNQDDNFSLFNIKLVDKIYLNFIFEQMTILYNNSNNNTNSIIKTKLSTQLYLNYGKILIDYCHHLTNDYNNLCSPKEDLYQNFTKTIIKKANEFLNKYNFIIYEEIEKYFANFFKTKLYNNIWIDKINDNHHDSPNNNNNEPSSKKIQELKMKIENFSKESKVINTTFDPQYIEKSHEELRKLESNVDWINFDKEKNNHLNNDNSNNSDDSFDEIKKKNKSKILKGKSLKDFINLFEYIENPIDIKMISIHEANLLPNWMTRIISHYNAINNKIKDDIAWKNFSKILPKAVTTQLFELIEELDSLFGSILEIDYKSFMRAEVFNISSFLFKVIGYTIEFIQKINDQISKEINVDWIKITDMIFLKYRLLQYNTLQKLIYDSSNISESYKQLNILFYQTLVFAIQTEIDIHLNTIQIYIISNIDFIQWKHYNVFSSTEIKEDLIKKLIQQSQSKLQSQIQDLTATQSSNIINLTYMKNITYSLRLLKKQYTHVFNHIQNNPILNDYTNILTIKFICQFIISTLLNLYTKYIYITPSRNKNQQYIQDLKYINDIIITYEKGILGIILLYIQQSKIIDKKISDHQEYNYKKFNIEDIFMINSLHNLWWIRKTINSLIVILESPYIILVNYLYSCINMDTILPEISDDMIDYNFHITEKIMNIWDTPSKSHQKKEEPKTSRPNTRYYNKNENATIDHEYNPEDIMYEKLTEKNDKMHKAEITITKHSRNLFIIKERLYALSLEQDKVPLDLLFKFYNNHLEDLLHKSDDYNSEKTPSMEHEILKNKMISENASFWKNDSIISIHKNKNSAHKIELKSLKEEIDVIFKGEDNPIIEFCKLHFIESNNDNVNNSKAQANDKFIKNTLKNTFVTPGKLVFFISKRVEFTQDVYPPLNEEQKRAQINLAEGLRNFCQHFKIDMIKVPEAQ